MKGPNRIVRKRTELEQMANRTMEAAETMRDIVCGNRGALVPIGLRIVDVDCQCWRRRSCGGEELLPVHSISIGSV